MEFVWQHGCFVRCGFPGMAASSVAFRIHIRALSSTIGMKTHKGPRLAYPRHHNGSFSLTVASTVDQHFKRNLLIFDNSTNTAGIRTHYLS